MLFFFSSPSPTLQWRHELSMIFKSIDMYGFTKLTQLSTCTKRLLHKEENCSQSYRTQKHYLELTASLGWRSLQINVSIFRGSVSICLLITICPCLMLETMLAWMDFGLGCYESWLEFHNCEIENRNGR